MVVKVRLMGINGLFKDNIEFTSALYIIRQTEDIRWACKEVHQEFLGQIVHKGTIVN